LTLTQRAIDAPNPDLMSLVEEVQDEESAAAEAGTATNGTAPTEPASAPDAEAEAEPAAEGEAADESDDDAPAAPAPAADESAPAGNATEPAGEAAGEAEEENSAESETDAAPADSSSVPAAVPAPTPAAAATGNGVSVVQFTVVNGRERAEDLVKKLFAKILIADATITAHQERFFMRNKKREMVEDGLYKVRVVTTDERMDELVREIDNLVEKKYDDISADITATHLTSGSPDYINWVKESVSDEAKLEKEEETSPSPPSPHALEDPVPNDPDALSQL
jgi:uncharacterized protein involved in tolerance to divalent cations